MTEETYDSFLLLSRTLLQFDACKEENKKIESRLGIQHRCATARSDYDTRFSHYVLLPMTTPATTSPITSLITAYLLAVREFGEEEVYHSLKEHYSDVCSNGDVVINEIIDALDEHYDSSTEELEAALFAVEDADRFAYHPTETLKWWIEDNKCSPDAYWAD